MIVSPSGRVPEWGPERLFVATEACGGGTPDLGFFSRVSIFIGIFYAGNKSGGSPSHPRDRGARPGGRARPPPSWWPRDSSSPSPVRGLLLVQNNLREILGQLDSVWFSISSKH